MLKLPNEPNDFKFVRKKWNIVKMQIMMQETKLSIILKV